MNKWNIIDAPPPSKQQRQALYRFGIDKRLVKRLAPSEASAVLDVLVRMVKRQAKQWNDKAEIAKKKEP